MVEIKSRLSPTFSVIFKHCACDEEIHQNVHQIELTQIRITQNFYRIVIVIALDLGQHGFGKRQGTSVVKLFIFTFVLSYDLMTKFVEFHLRRPNPREAGPI